MAGMRTYGALLAALAPLLIATAASDPEPNAALMDEIESTVALPKGAGPLSSYGRYYALSGAGRVRAIYMVPFERAKGGCETISFDGKNWTSRPCSQETLDRHKREEEAYLARALRAGARRWYDDARDVLWMLDGGCNQVTIEYDIAAKRFLSVACNGVA